MKLCSKVPEKAGLRVREVADTHCRTHVVALPDLSEGKLEPIFRQGGLKKGVGSSGPDHKALM